jgi:hypothetical protein
LVREDWLELAETYAPVIAFDRAEPFIPVRVGVTVFERDSGSPSFGRAVSLSEAAGAAFAIEYAIYWDWDIGHLYDLEHVWVFVGEGGDVVDCEASFHGKYLRGLLPDRSNLVGGTHVKLYSQPGKHAFSPLPLLFELIPDLRRACGAGAGNGGVLVNELFPGAWPKDERTDALVRRCLQSLAFAPTLDYFEYRLARELLVPWPELRREIPLRVNGRLAELEEPAGLEGL